MRRAKTLAGLYLGALVAMTGCSALIDPDTDSFGPGADSGAMDAGTRDSGARDAAGRDGGDTSDGGARDGSAPDSGPADGGPVCPPSCDDMISCTVDMCIRGRCTNRPDDDACPGDDRCSASLGCVPNHCTVDGECDDGLFCNGIERCDSATPGTGCVGGPPPVCDDGFSCTEDTCDAATDACEFTPMHARCGGAAACAEDVCDPGSSGLATGCVTVPDDGLCDTDYCRVGRTCDPVDGCRGGAPRDCDDSTPCTVDDCSSSAAMCTHTPVDADGDGFPAASVTPTVGPTVMCAGGTDCDDTSRDINPGAIELCNGHDDNCDGVADEGCGTLPDTCATAQELTLAGGTGTATAGGRFDRLLDDYRTNPICEAMTGGRDAVYYFDLPRGRFDVTVDTIGSAADTVLGVGFSCDAVGLLAACNDDIVSGDQDSRIWLHNVGSPASTTRVFVLVDAFSRATSAEYQLTVSVRPAAVDRCPGGTGAPMDITGGGTVLGYIGEAIGSQSSTCGPPFGPNPPEAVFRLSTPSSAMNFDVYSVDFAPNIYTRHTCSSPTTQFGCATSTFASGVNHAELSVSAPPGMSAYFFVDGGRGTYSAYYKPD